MSETRGTCNHCPRQFAYRLVHNGFNDTCYAYCSDCGRTAFVSVYDPRFLAIHPMSSTGINVFGYADETVLKELRSCTCGGRFSIGAAPRCPHCHERLSADAATAWIEANAPGTAAGYRWQGSWNGLYAVVIEDGRSDNPWKT